MTFGEIKNLITAQLPEAIVGEDLNATPNALLVEPKSIVPVCQLLHESEQTYFDSLSCVTGIDNGPEAETMEVVYNLYSIPHDLHLMIKCSLDRARPEIDSVSGIWRTANWLERETYDLVGIHFINHPDLRRILLPKDWEGHPLQKGYQQQEKYHGITVTYDRDDNQKEQI